MNNVTIFHFLKNNYYKLLQDFHHLLPSYTDNQDYLFIYFFKKKLITYVCSCFTHYPKHMRMKKKIIILTNFNIFQGINPPSWLQSCSYFKFFICIFYIYWRNVRLLFDLCCLICCPCSFSILLSIFKLVVIDSFWLSDPIVVSCGLRFMPSKPVEKSD